MPGFCPCYGPGCVEDVLSDRRNIEAANSAANVRAVEEATLGFVPFAETIGKTALAISTGEEEHAYSAMGSLAFDITPLAKGIAKAGKGLTKKSAELRNSTRIADDVLSPNALKNAALGNGKASKTPLATTLGRGSAATKALAKETKSAQASAKNLDYEEAVYPYQIQDNLKLLQKFHSSNKIDPLPGSDTYGALNRVSTRSWSKKSTDDSVAKQSDKTTPPTTGPPSASHNVVKVSSGCKGAWCKDLNKPQPNTTYLVDDNMRYVTDEYGRVSEVSGRLSQTRKDRNTYQQSQAGRGGAPEDEGGHLIASILGGPGERLNIVPMDANLNRGEWKRMENEWKKALDEGREVDVKIQPVYISGTGRPDRFEVIYEIDGVHQQRNIMNQKGG